MDEQDIRRAVSAGIDDFINGAVRALVSTALLIAFLLAVPTAIVVGGVAGYNYFADGVARCQASPECKHRVEQKWAREHP
ncbi:MAG: hypothetical protein ACLP0B_17890 [Steroidobacteraceae bacterium]|jgi:hypothetical protein